MFCVRVTCMLLCSCGLWRESLISQDIIHNNSSVDIREFVIRCFAQMIQALGKNIKSGWKSVFLVFATAASDPDGTFSLLFSFCFRSREQLLINT